MHVVRYNIALQFTWTKHENDGQNCRYVGGPTNTLYLNLIGTSVYALRVAYELLNVENKRIEPFKFYQPQIKNSPYFY